MAQDGGGGCPGAASLDCTAPLSQFIFTILVPHFIFTPCSPLNSYLHNTAHHQSHSLLAPPHNKNLSSTSALVDRFIWYISLHTSRNTCEQNASHTRRAHAGARCTHPADDVRQETRQQNVLGADGQHDEQQRLEAHNVALGADGERAA